MEKTPKPRLFASFRGRLLASVSSGIILLVLIVSSATAWNFYSSAAAQLTSQGLTVAKSLGAQSLLALLYESPANAEKPLATIMSFPEVEQAGIIYPDGSPLLTKTKSAASVPQIVPDESLLSPSKVHETKDRWHFAAPVRTGDSDDFTFPEDAPFAGEAEGQLLGFAYVVIDKGPLYKLLLTMVKNNALIALAVALFLVLVVNLIISRILTPLDRLIEVMRRNEQGRRREPVTETGPTEFINIARVFNRMIASLADHERQLRDQQEGLEKMVEQRTRELVVARDAALTANRQKSNFLANMSHELRTPLQAIIGYSEFVHRCLMKKGGGEECADLERVMRNADLLLTLINNILQMAKIDAGKAELTLQRINLRKLLEEAVDAMHPLMWKNHNEMTVIFDLENDFINIDREKLLQMVLNLVSNAGKFTQNGEVELLVKGREELLEVRVKDTGIGLSPEQQSLIFQEFRQVDESPERRFEGSGLGLAITREFARLMGGEIAVTSELGKGATFCLSIPLPIAELPDHEEGKARIV